MGHLRLGHLPHTYKWKQVIALLEDGASLPELANASFDASLTGLKRVASDTGFLSILNKIFEITEASRAKNLGSALSKIGIGKEDQSSSIGFLSSMSKIMSDSLSKVYPRADVGKIAHDAFIESITRKIRAKSGSLLGDSEDAKSLTESFRGKQFESLMHEFYSGFTSRYLSYYLSRELPHHVGEGKPFANLDEHAEFSRQLDLYCRQTVRITDEFTPGWIGKAIYQGDIGREAVNRYAHVAFKKLISEFQRSGR